MLHKKNVIKCKKNIYYLLIHIWVEAFDFCTLASKKLTPGQRLLGSFWFLFLKVSPVANFFLVLYSS